MFDSYSVYPFYNTYPVFTGWDQYTDQQMMEDLGYLQQMYPALSKKLQIKIGDLLDKLDYEGSVIYDQYPDKIGLEKLAQTIYDTLMGDKTIMSQKEELAPEHKQYMKELVTILLYGEILKKRHKQQKYYVF